jgi:hypothetical protein
MKASASDVQQREQACLIFDLASAGEAPGSPSPTLV